MMQKVAKAFRIRFEAPPKALFTLIIWNSGRIPFWKSSTVPSFFPWAHLRTCTDPSCAFWNILKTDFQLTKTKSTMSESTEMHRRLLFLRQRATTSNTAHFLHSRAHVPFPNVSVLRRLRPTGKPAPVPNTHAADLLPVPEALSCSWWFYGTYLSVCLSVFKNLFPHWSQTPHILHLQCKMGSRRLPI